VHEPALSPGRVGEQLREQRRVDRARAQRVAPNPAAGVLDGDFAGHGEDGALRRGVGGLRRRRPQPRDERRDVDDRAAARGGHRRNAEFAPERHAFHVDRERPVPHAFVGRVHRAVVAQHDAGVVVQDVEASEPVDRRPNHLGGVALSRDVGVDEQRLAALPVDPLDDLVSGIVVHIGQGHPGALGREQGGGDTAHPTAAAGDQRDLAVEPPHTTPSERFDCADERRSEHTDRAGASGRMMGPP
jgi:hypothetical protein